MVTMFMKNEDFTINILTTDGPQYDYLIYVLENIFTVNVVIREPGKYQRKRLISRKKYYRYISNRYQWFSRKILGYNKYRVNYFKYMGPLKSKIVNTTNINSNSVIELLTQNPSNLCIVMGTSILKKKIIDVCKSEIINIHGGYLPYYRGNNCIYFAYLNDDWARIANTIHFIDTGIDTGDIIEIVHPTILPHDTPETLYCKAKKKAIHTLVKIIKKYQNNEEIPRISQDVHVGKQYKTEERNIKTAIVYYYKQIKRMFKKEKIRK